MRTRVSWPALCSWDRTVRARMLGWEMCHKIRTALMDTEFQQLMGLVEVDETYLGAPEEGFVGRGVQDKALIVIAEQADGKGIGRIRMRVIQHPSAASLHPFVADCIEPGSTVHTDAWQGYAGLKSKGYDHEVTSVQRRRPKEVSTLLPRVHLVVSLLKRWLSGTHQGGVSHEHLPYYLDEFTFRFNRRKSKSRGKLFFRLVQQAVDTGPTTYAHGRNRQIAITQLAFFHGCLPHYRSSRESAPPGDAIGALTPRRKRRMLACLRGGGRLSHVLGVGHKSEGGRQDSYQGTA